ncbi:MAG: TlpA family protein disulfide reductase [bacterium]
MKKIILTLFLSVIALTTCFSKERNTLAPNFKGITSKGDAIKLSDFKGKVILLDFWASWCRPCQKEFPFLIDLYNENKEKDFIILTINLDEQIVNMNKFLSKLEREVPLTIIVDKDGKIPLIYEVEAMPTTIFIDKKGVIRYRHTGFKESHKLKYKNELNNLLTEK